jgi:hypothetical protein
MNWRKSTVARPIIIVPSGFHPLNFALRMMYHGFALLGVVSSLILLGLYLQGWHSVAPLDSQFVNILSHFLQHTLQQDTSSALIVKVPVPPQVKLSTAVDSLKQTAGKFNLKFLNSYALHKEFTSTHPVHYAEVLAFAAPAEFEILFLHNPDITAFLPIHIAAYEDSQGKAWLAVLNWHFMIYGAHHLVPTRKAQVLGMQDNLLKILGTAATGQ